MYCKIHVLSELPGLAKTARSRQKRMIIWNNAQALSTVDSYCTSECSNAAHLSERFFQLSGCLGELQNIT